MVNEKADEEYLSVQQLIDQLTEIVKNNPEKANAYVCTYACGMRKEDGLEALEEEYPYRVFYVDHDLGDSRIDLNF